MPSQPQKEALKIHLATHTSFPPIKTGIIHLPDKITQLATQMVPYYTTKMAFLYKMSLSSLGEEE